MDVLFESSEQPPLALGAEQGGFFSGFAADLAPGARYRYRLDEADAYPDPWSRFQPDGPHGASVVVDPAAFEWTDDTWRGLDPARQVIYELHIGAFTPAGTYCAAADKLPVLRELGVTCIELMPVAEFAGRRGWGYDGVCLFAPYHEYGTPDDLRAFIDRAHACGLGVVLDVVYNHVGADGNYLPKFSREYFTDRHSNEWGETINYYCEPVRRFAIDNAAYWIREFHFDGLRLDAIQSVHDPQEPRLLADLVTAARAAAGSRTVVISAEDYLQRASLLRPIEQGGAGLDHLWNDDFHHAARVAMTRARGGYLARYTGSAQELSSALRRGFLFQGQLDAWKGKPRGSSTRGLDISRFVAFTQNHDQVANTLNGQRLHRFTSPGQARVMAMVLLLGPHTPLLFMGQECESAPPFTYFADYEGEAAQALWEGRRRELRQFEQYTTAAAQAAVGDPSAPETFERSKLDWDAMQANSGTRLLYRDLLALRSTDEVLARRPTAEMESAVLSSQAFALRWYDDERGDRLLLANPGEELARGSIAEPLLAPPMGHAWELVLSTDHPAYGGLGIVAPENELGWHVAARAGSFLRAVRTAPSASSSPAATTAER